MRPIGFAQGYIGRIAPYRTVDARFDDEPPGPHAASVDGTAAVLDHLDGRYRKLTDPDALP